MTENGDTKHLQIIVSPHSIEVVPTLNSILAKQDRKRIVLSYVEEDPVIVTSLQIRMVESNGIDEIINHPITKTYVTSPFKTSKASDQVDSVLTSVVLLLNEDRTCDLMVERAKLLDCVTSIGSIKEARLG